MASSPSKVPALFRTKDPNTVIQGDGYAFRLSQVKALSIRDLGMHRAVAYVDLGERGTLTRIYIEGFDALELVWHLKPGILEGDPSICYPKHAWVLHNVVAHPLMQFLAFMGLYKQAMKVHDNTVPKPIGFKARK